MQTGKFNFIAICLVAVACLSSSCKSGGDAHTEGIELTLNFNPGDQYIYSTEVNQKINAMGMTGITQKMLMEMVYELKATEGVNKKLNITYNHIEIKNESPMGNVSYDSKNRTASKSGMEFMDSLIGKSFQLSIAPDGAIVAVEGLDHMLQALTGFDGASKSEIEKQFGDSSVKMMMQNSFDLYPGKKVRIGETWGKNSQMSFSGFNINVDNKYTLKSVENGIARITVRSILSLPAAQTAQQGLNLQMEGLQEGVMEVAVTTGQIISGKTHQTISGKIKAAGQEMPMDIKGDILISSRKL